MIDPASLGVNQPGRRPQKRRNVNASPERARASIVADRIPQELRELERWVNWRYLVRNDKPTKVPYRSRLARPGAPRAQAKSTDPATWATFDEALAAYRDPGSNLDGIGFVFARGGGLVGVDFDACLAPDGTVLDWARAYLDRLVGYAEVSPSGRGLKVFTRGEVPGGGGRKLSNLGPDGKGAIEVYGQGRYFTVTSSCLLGRDAIGDGSAELATLHAEWFPPKAFRPRLPPPAGAGFVGADGDLIRMIERSKQSPKFAGLWAGSTDGHKSKSEADLALCSILRFWVGQDPASIDRLFRQSGLYDAKWEDRPDYRERTINKALPGEVYNPSRRVGPDAARERSRQPRLAVVRGEDDLANGGDGGGVRPDIEVGTELHEARDRANAALAAHPQLYTRQGAIVEIVREDRDELRAGGRISLRGVAGTPKICPVHESNIACELTRIATFHRWVPDRSGECRAISIIPPSQLVRAISTTRIRPGWRILDGVAECPFPRADGSLVEADGYDAATHTYLATSVEFPPVPNLPTHRDAIAAWGRIAYWIKDFPFATEDDRVVYLAGLLTVIARPAIDGAAPGIAVIGNRSSTGKGYLIDAMVIPGTGRACPTMTYPKTNEEASKVKATIALSSKVAVHFDNLDNGSTYGGSTDSTLTSITSDERLLHTNEAPELAVRAAFFLSGNNIAPAKDAHRRWLVCRLITDREDPENRTDLTEPDLRPALIANRPGIVRDALTILKAHALAGWPAPPWSGYGSYEDWDRIVRRAVWFATGRDCRTTQREAITDSPERQYHLGLLEGIWEMHEARPGGRGLTSAAILGLVETNPSAFETLRETLQSRMQNGKPFTSGQLGITLRTIKNTPIGGFRLTVHPKLQHQAQAWIVERLDLVPGEGGEDGEAICQKGADEFPSHRHAIEYAINHNHVWVRGTQGSPSSPPSPLKVVSDPKPDRGDAWEGDD